MTTPSRYLLSVPQFCEQNPAFTLHVTPCYPSYMLHSFHDKDTEALFNGQRVRCFEAVKAQAERRLQILDSATSLADLAGLPSNRLEALHGDRRG